MRAFYGNAKINSLPVGESSAIRRNHPMNENKRNQGRTCLFKSMLVGIGLLVAVAVIWISVDPGDYLREYSDATKRRAAVEKIRQQGGIVILSPADPTSAVNVDLRNVAIDTEVLKTVALCKGVERLGLDGANLRPEDCELLATLPQLNSLSLSGSNITDAHVAKLPKRISELRLNRTAIADDSISQFVTMPNLKPLTLQART